MWDLRARLLDIALVNLLGRVRDGIPVYGSGGFTSYNDAQLRAQFGSWAENGINLFKMKVGIHPMDDPHRATLARETIGDASALFVDANVSLVPETGISAFNNVRVLTGLPPQTGIASHASFE